ncbi:putative groupII intron reverse transcriptase /maturase (mitochondrion) [Bryopsis sp. KO-2023]|nr:putative groupII intron reverse transcriptase /maturase [Bryopsis sp. KO-2023]
MHYSKSPPRLGWPAAYLPPCALVQRTPRCRHRLRACARQLFARPPDRRSPSVKAKKQSAFVFSCVSYDERHRSGIFYRPCLLHCYCADLGSANRVPCCPPPTIGAAQIVFLNPSTALETGDRSCLPAPRSDKFPAAPGISCPGGQCCYPSQATYQLVGANVSTGPRVSCWAPIFCRRDPQPIRPSISAWCGGPAIGKIWLGGLVRNLGTLVLRVSASFERCPLQGAPTAAPYFHFRTHYSHVFRHKFSIVWPNGNSRLCREFQKPPTGANCLPPETRPAQFWAARTNAVHSCLPVRRRSSHWPINISRSTKIPKWVGLPEREIKEAKLLVLEILFDPIFSEFSHGFRTGRGCHSAFQQIKHHWIGTSWLFVFDIRKWTGRLPQARAALVYPGNGKYKFPGVVLEWIQGRRLASAIRGRAGNPRLFDIFHTMFNTRPRDSFSAPKLATTRSTSLVRITAGFSGYPRPVPGPPRPKQKKITTTSHARISRGILFSRPGVDGRLLGALGGLVSVSRYRIRSGAKTANYVFCSRQKRQAGRGRNNKLCAPCKKLAPGATILGNIYLHWLDKQVERIQNYYNRKKQRRINYKYKRAVRSPSDQAASRHKPVPPGRPADRAWGAFGPSPVGESPRTLTPVGGLYLARRSRESGTRTLSRTTLDNARTAPVGGFCCWTQRRSSNSGTRVQKRGSLNNSDPQKIVKKLLRHRAASRYGVFIRDYRDRSFVRVRYARYADHVLLGVAGPRQVMDQIRNLILHFLQTSILGATIRGKIAYERQSEAASRRCGRSPTAGHCDLGRFVLLPDRQPRRGATGQIYASRGGPKHFCARNFGKKLDYGAIDRTPECVHVASGYVKFLDTYIKGIPVSKFTRRFSKEIEKRRRVKARIQLKVAQREEAWNNQLQQLALEAFAWGLKKTQLSLGSRFLAKQALFQTARKLADNFAQQQRSKTALRELQARESQFIRDIAWNFLPADIREAHRNLSEMLNRHKGGPAFRQENCTAWGSTETQSTGVTHARPPRPPKVRAGTISLCNYNLFAHSAKKVCPSIAGAACGTPLSGAPKLPNRVTTGNPQNPRRRRPRPRRPTVRPFGADSAPAPVVKMAQAACACTITRPVANPPLRQGVPSGGRNRSLRVIAPIPVIMDKLRTFGLIITAKCRPAPARNLTNVPDSSIVKWYTALAHAILSYYRCCDNFHKVKSIVDYHVRWSAIFTLATKHKSSASKVIYKYSRDLIIPGYAGDHKRDTIARFPAKWYLAKVGRRFCVDIERGRVDKILKTPPRAF